MQYFEINQNLTTEDKLIRDGAHRFAEEVMRPIGQKLDKMTPEEVVADDSPLHDYMRQIHESGILDLGALAEMDNQQKSRIFPIIFEELGWGDSGLAIATLGSSCPLLLHTIPATRRLLNGSAPSRVAGWPPSQTAVATWPT